MNYRILGQTAMKVSEISLGGMSLPQDQSACHQIIHYALDHGINFFDTADLYEHGDNEIRLGNALTSKRQDVFVATKVGNQWNPDGKSWSWNPTKSYIMRAVEQSLKRLKTDYIDLYQLHGGTIDDPYEEIIEAFELLVQQGKIRNYGISSIRPNVINIYSQKSNIQSVMMQYSLLDRRPEEQALPLLNNRKISVLARGSLAKGFLINKKAKPYLHYSEEEIIKLQKEINKHFEGHPQAIAMSYVLCNPTVASAVIGVSSLEQLQSSLAVCRKQLSQNELTLINNIFKVNYYQAHR